MAEQLAERLWSAEEYLEWESAQPYKHELIDNRIFPMTGGSRAHNLVTGQLIYLLISRLSDKGCEVYPGNMQVQVDQNATYTYPDVVVICGAPRFRSGSMPALLQNPTLLFEVLSPSTEKIDRNQKREQFLQIPSLFAYFLVSQDKPLIEAYLRSGDDWRFTECAGLDATLQIPAPACEIPLREVYRRVRFDDS